VEFGVDNLSELSNLPIAFLPLSWFSLNIWEEEQINESRMIEMMLAGRKYQ